MLTCIFIPTLCFSLFPTVLQLMSKTDWDSRLPPTYSSWIYAVSVATVFAPLKSAIHIRCGWLPLYCTTLINGGVSCCLISVGIPWFFEPLCLQNRPVVLYPDISVFSVICGRVLHLVLIFLHRYCHLYSPLCYPCNICQFLLFSSLLSLLFLHSLLLVSRACKTVLVFGPGRSLMSHCKIFCSWHILRSCAYSHYLP